MLYHLRTAQENIEFISFDDIKVYKSRRIEKGVSIILPTYNEELLIGKLIEDLAEKFSEQKYEIIVVDDSSPDKTTSIVRNIIINNPNIVLLERKAKGVFSAQRDGAKVAVGETIILMDADFSHPPSKAKELIDNIEGFDMVSASRFLPGSGILAPFSRKYSTILLNLFLKVLLNLKISDYSSIFFAVNRKKWEELNFYYDSVWGEAGMEIYKQVRLHKIKMKEIPFTYNFREEGESKADNMLKYGWIYFKRAIQIKFFYKNKQ